LLNCTVFIHLFLKIRHGKQSKKEAAVSIHESGENYLETILILQNKLGFVRSVDIANELDYTKPSISRAVSILKNADYITVEDSGQILLTQKGMTKATEIYERHRIISKFLIQSLGVSADTADQDACRIEHIISRETFSKMKKYIEETN
jgi:Mn-dependent DtxR family transcriptional regulator